MPTCRSEKIKVKSPKLKYSNCHYTQTMKTNSNIQKWNTVDDNMQRFGKQIKVYRTDILQMSICRNEESKVKSTQLKKCKCQYAETRQEKLNIQN